MTRNRFALLSIIVPALCALSVDAPIETGDEHATLEEYVYNLTLQCDMQIEEIAAAIPPEQIETLRSEHYAWRLQRDVHCADVGRNSSDELAELMCLSKLTGEYFDRREVEISEIEARQGKTPAQK